MEEALKNTDPHTWGTESPGQETYKAEPCAGSQEMWPAPSRIPLRELTHTATGAVEGIFQQSDKYS